MSGKRLLTYEEAAESVGMSPTWIKAQVRAGLLPICKLGTRVRIEPADLDDLIARHRVVKSVGTSCVPGESPTAAAIPEVIEKTVGVSR